MRPLVLRLKGFTAFREEQELDLRGLDLFAISGATGAGKSSLLDAMTYALYGRVERVNDEVGQLISQGLTAMSVELEFDVGGVLHRVGRRTPQKGASRTILEERQGDAWVPVADQSRDVTRRIERLIGLDYAAFTRAVLLPQGKFDQFLAGKPDDRRRILTELLDLGLFERMAKRAGELARDALADAQLKRALMEREYANATEEAFAEAHAAAARARARSGELEKAAEAADRVAARRRDALERLEQLTSCATDAAEAAEALRIAARRIAELEAELTRCTATATAASTREAAARRGAVQADGKLADAERKTGTLSELAAALSRAERLAELREEIAEHERGTAALTKHLPRLVTERKRADTALKGATRALETAREGLVAQQRADQAAALTRGLRKGDLCPVCGEPLAKAPQAAPPSAVKAAAALAEAERALAAAAAASESAAREVADAERELAHAAKEGAALAKRAADAERALTKSLTGPAGADPLATIRERSTRVESLADARDAAAAAAAEAGTERARLESARDRVSASLDVTRAGLGLAAAAALRARAVDLAGPGVPPLPKGSAPLPAADALDTIAAALRALATESGSEAAYLAEAHRAVGAIDLPTRARTAAAFRDEIAAAARDAARAAARAEADALGIAATIEKRRALEVETRTLEAHGTRYRALAGDLKADRIVDFLQGEALRLLAIAGSAQLTHLSAGRYRLVYAGDEFAVVDTWNGEEQRSVKTLSGGETFLASLALAVALANQVRALAVTERARIDSLFLDEGFGALDQETLGVAVEALERLGGDGRLVCVITHVREMAEQLPRIEVTKSPAGSRIERLRV